MKRVFCLVLIGLISLSLWAERPAHRPQTIAEEFLRSMQLRDFDSAGQAVLPAQKDLFDTIAQWADVSGWFAAASRASDFPVLRSVRTSRTMSIDYDLLGKGIAYVKMQVSDGAWYVDLAATTFQANNAGPEKSLVAPANSFRNPRDRAKIFLEALFRADFATAASIGTPRTNALLKLIASFAPYGERKSGDATTVEIVSESIDGEAATVVYRNAGVEHNLAFIKLGADWMVDLAPDQVDF